MQKYLTSFLIMHKTEITQAAYSVLPPRAAVMLPVLAVVYQRCGLNLAMVTPWKKQGEAGILVWLALFLA